MRLRRNARLAIAISGLWLLVGPVLLILLENRRIAGLRDQCIKFHWAEEWACQESYLMADWSHHYTLPIYLIWSLILLAFAWLAFGIAYAAISWIRRRER